MTKNKKIEVQEEEVKEVEEIVVEEKNIPPQDNQPYTTFEVKLLSSCAKNLENHLRSFRIGMNHAEMKYKQEGFEWQ